MLSLKPISIALAATVFMLSSAMAAPLRIIDNAEPEVGMVPLVAEVPELEINSAQYVAVQYFYSRPYIRFCDSQEASDNPYCWNFAPRVD